MNYGSLTALQQEGNIVNIFCSAKPKQKKTKQSRLE